MSAPKDKYPRCRRCGVACGDIAAKEIHERFCCGNSSTPEQEKSTPPPSRKRKGKYHDISPEYRKSLKLAGITADPEKRVFRCDVCSMEFPSGRSALLHKRIHPKPEPIKDGGVLQCPGCGFKTRSPGGMGNHLKRCAGRCGKLPHSRVESGRVRA